MTIAERICVSMITYNESIAMAKNFTITAVSILLLIKKSHHREREH